MSVSNGTGDEPGPDVLDVLFGQLSSMGETALAALEQLATETEETIVRHKREELELKAVHRVELGGLRDKERRLKVVLKAAGVEIPERPARGARKAQSTAAQVSDGVVKIVLEHILGLPDEARWTRQDLVAQVGKHESEIYKTVAFLREHNVVAKAGREEGTTREIFRVDMRDNGWRILNSLGKPQPEPAPSAPLEETTMPRIKGTSNITLSRVIKAILDLKDQGITEFSAAELAREAAVNDTSTWLRSGVKGLADLNYLTADKVPKTNKVLYSIKQQAALEAALQPTGVSNGD